MRSQAAVSSRLIADEGTAEGLSSLIRIMVRLFFSSYGSRDEYLMKSGFSGFKCAAGDKHVFITLLFHKGLSSDFYKIII